MAEAWPAGRSRHGGIDRVPVPERPGQLWLAGKHFVGPNPEAALAEVGGDTVVCLCERFELAERYPGYVEWLQTERRALWFPIPDLHAPSEDQAIRLVGDLDVRLSRGEVVLMHCGAGIGRAGTMAAALLLGIGRSLDDALTSVAEARPMGGPEVGAQTELLEQLSRSLRPSAS